MTADLTLLRARAAEAAPPAVGAPAELNSTAHSASYFSVASRYGAKREVVDFCIPCNPYFPTPAMFPELAERLPTLLKYYPSDSSVTTKTLCSLLGLHPQTVAM